MNPTLTTAQKTTLKNDLTANTNTVLINGVATAINVVPHGAQNAQTIADWYNLLCAVDFFGNYAEVPLSAVKGAIAFKNYTPTDPVPTADVLSATIHMARSLFAQTFQLSLNNLFITGATFDATNATLVSALKDATNTDM